MPRRATEFRAGSYYHLYNRGVNRERVFIEAENYVFFLRQLRYYLEPDADIIAYCLMPNHYHLLVRLKTDDVTKSIGAFSISFAKAMNKRYERVGPLFQGRFASKIVDNDSYLLHLSRYIHLNPVNAGMVEKAEDWEYSSYSEFIGTRKGTLPQPDDVLLQLMRSSSDQQIMRSAYRQYVESWCSTDDSTINHLLLD